MLRAVLIVLRKEILEVLREPNTLVMSVAFPLLLYPSMIWGASQVFSFVAALREGRPTVVAAADPEAAALLAEVPGSWRVAPMVPLDAADAAIAQGEVDAVVSATRGADGGLATEVRRSSVRWSSRRGGEAVQGALRREARARAELLGVAVGLPPSAWQREVQTEDRGGNAATVGFLLSLLLPQSLVLMGLMTTLYPAVEAAVGERERGTLETLLVTQPSRAALLVGKLLAVLAVSLVGVVANLGAVILSAQHLVHLMHQGIPFEVDFSPQQVLAFLGLAILTTTLSAGANLVAALPARSFKQAQNAGTLVVTVGTMLSLAGTMENAQLASGYHWLPYGGIILLMRAIVNHEVIAPADAGIVLGLHAGLALVLFGVALVVVRREAWWMR